MRLVVLLCACLAAACGPSIRVELEGDGNADLSSFEDKGSFFETDSDLSFLWIIEFATGLNDELGTTTWSRRSFSINLQPELAPGTFTVEDGDVSAFFGFHPVPKDDTDEFKWEASAGTMVIEDLDDESVTILLENLALEPTGDDAEGVIFMNATGVAKRKET